MQILVDLQTINSPPGYPEPIIKDDIKIKAEPHVQSEPVVIKSDIESNPRSKPQPTINCSHYETIPASFKHKVTALTSFMGSGNTWTRHLIHRASGYWTGSIYSDTALHINGMIPEFIKPLDCEDAQDNSPYILVKSHRWPDWAEGINPICKSNRGCPCEFQQAVFIVRNPFDAILSEFQRQRSIEKYGEKSGNSHTEKLSKTEIFEIQEKWEKFATNMARHWFNLVKGWVADYDRGQVKIVCYEKLVKNPKTEINSVLEFLDLNSDKMAERAHCLNTEIEGKFHRKKEFTSYEVYNDKMMKTVVDYVRKARQILEDKNQVDCFDGFEIPDEIMKKFEDEVAK